MGKKEDELIKAMTRKSKFKAGKVVTSPKFLIQANAPANTKKSTMLRAKKHVEGQLKEAGVDPINPDKFVPHSAAAHAAKGQVTVWITYEV